MSVIVPLEGKYLALTVIGKTDTNVIAAFPANTVFNWSINNPVIANISEIIPGDGTIRKIAPNASGGKGTVIVTCVVSFIDVYNENATVTLTNTFTVLIGEELPVQLDFQSVVEDNI